MWLKFGDGSYIIFFLGFWGTKSASFFEIRERCLKGLVPTRSSRRWSKGCLSHKAPSRSSFQDFNPICSHALSSSFNYISILDHMPTTLSPSQYGNLSSLIIKQPLCNLNEPRTDLTTVGYRGHISGYNELQKWPLPPTLYPKENEESNACKCVKTERGVLFFTCEVRSEWQVRMGEKVGAG